MKKRSIISIISIMFLLITSLFALSACGDDSYRVIKLFSYTGDCSVVRGNDEIAVEREGMTLKNNDELKVKANSNAILKLDNDKFICAKENTNIKLEATGSKNKTKTRLHVEDGGVIVEVKEKLKQGEKFEIASSNSVMAIRGTQISFDVEKTSDSITSTFSILKGETEIFLYKDETMDSTTLIQEYMMSYTTSLIISTDEIYKIYDSTKHNPISDEDLENVYKVKKVPISSKRINEMVEVVNEFEKVEDDLVNGVIEFNMDSNARYNIDPKTLITILDANKYTDMKDLVFTYSKTIDGKYEEYDPSKPLAPGTYFVKIDAGNAYKSDSYEFRIIKGLIDAKIDSNIPFGVDPSAYITVNGSYDDLRYVYSSSENGVYGEYSSTNPLTTGSYFAKVENDYYSSNPMSFNIVKGTIDMSLKNESIAYGTNPNTNITLNGTYNNVVYKYSKTLNGTYREYSSIGTLSLGTWYVQATSGSQFISNKLSFTVVPAKLNATLSSDSVEYSTNPSSIVTINGTYSNIKYLYSETETGDFVEYDTENPLDAGFYYVKVVSGNEYISDILEFEITPKEITFTLGDSVAYRVNPSTIITITNGTYPNATYLYRKAGSTTDLEFDSSNPFEVGTWYVSISNGSNYTSSRKSFEVVQAEIDYSLTSTSVEYGTNPNTIITLNGTYPTVTYKYSTSENGTYSEFDNSNPLAIGTYYVKLFINDNYKSTAKQFSVTKKLISYTITSPITYGENIISYINVTGSYDQVEYYYSTSSSFTNPTELDSTTVLNPNTYYIKLVSGTDYESEIKSFVITAIEIDYTVPSEISYATDPSRAIRINGTYPTITYTYSQSTTGTFREYSDNNRLTIGTWYVKLTISDGYTAEIKSFDVVKAIQAFELSSTSIPYGDDLSNYITDSLNRNIMISTNGTTYSLYDPATALSVGTYYIKLENDYYTSNPREITITERQFTVSNITIKDNYITATIKTLESSGSKTFKVTYYLDKNDPLTTELFNDGDRYYFQVMDLTDSSTVKFKYLYYIDDVLTDETDYYIIDSSNLEDLSLGTDFELTESRSAFALHTFNSDGTINLYYDLGFVNNTSYDLVCEVTYGTYSIGEADVSYSNQNKVFTTSEFLTLTDLAYRSWAVCGIRVLKLVDGIYYVAYEDFDNENYDYEVCRPLFDAKAAANGIYYDYDDYFYEISASFNTVLEVDGIATVTVKVTDYNWDEVVQTITFTSDDPTRVVNVSCDDLDELYVTISYTRVISIKSDLAQKIFDSSHTSDMKINNASQLEEVAEAMEEKFGITIKGTFSRDYYLETYFEPEQW